MDMARDHYHHGNLHQELVQAARGLIETAGVTGLSLRGVAREAGVSQAAPYHHFSNKEALLAEVSQQGFEQLIAGILAAMGESESASVRMQAMGLAYISFGLEHPKLYDLMFSNECPAERHPVLKSVGGRAFGLVVESVMRGQAQGIYRDGEPVHLAMAVWSSVHGLVSLLQNRLGSGKEMGGVELIPEVLVHEVLHFVDAALTRVQPASP
jgi:AcrR family transcriptional regulator